jgi:hypothetical protein
MSKRSSSSSFGRPPKDFNVDSLASGHLTSNMISSLEHIDTNVVEIEKDIYDLQGIVYDQSEESLNTSQEIATVQNDLVELQYIQSLPWFCKSNFVYGEIVPDNWNIAAIPNASNQLFIRYIELQDTYTGMILILPRSNIVGESRHVSIVPKSSEAVVYISVNPADTVRLTSFDIEWLPPTSINDSDRFIGHLSLLAKPVKLNGYVFGSSSPSDMQGSQCVVFPNSGSFYIQSLYLDNNAGHTRIVMIGQKYQSSAGASLVGFDYYGIQ